MAFTKTEVCNMALGRIGARVIMDFNDDDKNANACRNAYELVVKEAARSNEWACLKRRIELARDATAPAFGWSYSYTLPVDCMLVCELNGVDYQGQSEDVFEIEAGKMLTNAESAKIVYVAYDENPAKWDPLFTSAVVALLGSRVAVTLRQDEGVSNALLSEYTQLSMPKAGKQNFNEKKRRRFDPMAESRVLASRYRSTND